MDQSQILDNQKEARIEFNKKDKSESKENKEKFVKRPYRKRFFSWEQKNQCWEKAPVMIGRHPDRWRLDPYGNPVSKVDFMDFR